MKRPERLHAETPWPVENEWAAAKVAELLPGGVGDTIWTDETCDEQCVVRHNAGGEQVVYRNPDCTIHGKDTMTYPPTPELDKLTETHTLAEFTQRLGEALDDTEGFVLAEWVPDKCHNCGGRGQIFRFDGGLKEELYDDCALCKTSGNDPHEITLAHRSPSNRNLAVLFGLDHDKMEDERTAVLQYVQEAGP